MVAITVLYVPLVGSASITDTLRPSMAYTRFVAPNGLVTTFQAPWLGVVIVATTVL